MLIDTKVKGSPLAQKDRAQTPDNSTTADLSTLTTPNLRDKFLEDQITRAIQEKPLTKDEFVERQVKTTKIGLTEMKVELFTAA